ncbi:MAG: ankyrin repeat domain-containing protein [Sedimenticola sp.]
MRWKALLTALLVLLLNGCGQPDRPTIGLYLAIQRGDIDQIERHIRWGADINKMDVDGRRPLHVAADRGRYVIARLLLKNGADINAPNREGHPPIHSALLAGRTQVAELFLKQGADFDGNRLLEQMVSNDTSDRDVVEFLLSRGADIDHIDPEGATPLTRAVGNNLRVMTKLLIAAGADVNKTDAAGNRPLDIALGENNQDIVRLLRRNGARESTKQ